MKFIIKYWAQITGVLAILAFLSGWCWRLAIKFDSLILTVQQNTKQIDSLNKIVADHDETLDDHEGKLLVLDTKEDLRERGLLK